MSIIEILRILILAIIQGVTEWLPVSSSGHLVLAQSFMGLSLPPFFDVMLHLGSLVVVLSVFRHEVFNIIKSVGHLDFKSEDGKLALYVILGSIPTALIGFFFKDLLESLFSNVLAVGAALIVMGGVLFLSKFARVQTRLLDPVDSLLIGIAQGIALIPGISRSGITITTGLLRKVDKKRAFTFSFLLFIPAVIGAAVLTAGEAQGLAIADVDYASAALALIVTIVVGYFSLKLLLRILLMEKFHWFAYYCWAVGAVVVLTQILLAP